MEADGLGGGCERGEEMGGSVEEAMVAAGL